MTEIKLPTKNGFTLIELLVSLTVVAVIGVFIVQSVFTVVRVNTKVELLKEIKQNGDNAMDVISRKIQNARTVVCDGTYKITVNNFDNTINVIESAYDALNSSCRLKMDSLYLTSSNITLKTATNCTSEGIVLTCDPAAAPASVKISFEIIQKGAPSANYEQANMKFSSLVNIRN